MAEHPKLQRTMNTMKRTPYIIALVAAVAMWSSANALQSAESSSQTETASTQEKPVKPSGKKSRMRLVKTSEPPPKVVKSKSKVELKGYHEKSVIQDINGKVLLSAAELKNSIISIKISPSGQRAIVHGGNGYNQIYDLEPFRAAQILPLQIDVPRAWAFDQWEWIDDNTLVGISAIGLPEEEEEKLTGESEEACERTLIFTYTLSDGVLTEIDPTTVGLPAVFVVIDTREGGYLKVKWREAEFWEKEAKTMWVRIEKTDK